MEEMDIKYTLEKFEELLDIQQRALDKSTDLIELKNELIEILEEEIKIRRRHNLILASMLIVCFIAFAFITSLYCAL